MQLADTHVFITGGSRGIGAGLAAAFHARGARVTVAGRDAAALREVAEPIGAHVAVADLTDPETRNGLIARVEAEAGPIDVLVNNAGVETGGAFTELSAEDLSHLYSLNALTPAELCRQALPGMIERGRGHIVNVSSLAGCGVLPGMVGYSATKASLTHLTAGLRADLRGLPINTTVVEVGLVPTSMKDRVLDYAPSEAAFRRFYRLGLLTDTKLERLCEATVNAVEHDRRHVRLPRRALLFSLLPEASRRIAEWILTGVRARR